MKYQNNEASPANCGFLSVISMGCLIFFLPVMEATGAEVADFNPSFLSHTPGERVIDVRRFSYGNPTPAGTYNVDVYLNGVWKGKLDIIFTNTEHPRTTSMLCLTPELINLLDLTPGTMASENDSNQCHSLTQEIPSSDIRFELSSLRLDIAIPQRLLVQRPRGYIAPSQWQTGVPASFIQYNVNNYLYHSSYGDSNQSYLGLRGGFNVGGWAFRHRGSRSWGGARSAGYSSIETNLRHDIARIRAQLMIGDFTTSGELMDSVSLRGVRIASDDRMLPGSLRGYAPVVRGIANSNSKVTIRQNGNIIYEMTVPAGPYSIDDIYPSGYGGDLTVTVTESSGQSRSFIVPFSSVARLIRPGYMQWQFSAGRYRYTNEILSDVVLQGEGQYGLTNDVTLNGGVTVAPHYAATLAGLAFNTPLGSIASDITLTRTSLASSGETSKGYGLHASYSVSFPSTSTNLTLATYRFSSRNFYNLRDAMWGKHGLSDDAISATDILYYRPKNQFQLSVNQSLGETLGSFYITGSTFQYWGLQGSRNEYQIGYSNFWKRFNYQIGFSQSRANDSYRRDERLFLNVSVPLGDSFQSPSLSTTLNYSKQTGNSLQTSVSGTAGEDNAWSYGLSFNRQAWGTSGYSLNGGYRSSAVNLSATAGNDSAHHRQMSFGASGAIVAHPYGVTMSNDLSDTFSIIHAKGARGAVINNAPGNRLDYWGNGIVPYVTPYEKNRISIDPSNLPVDMELSATEQEIIPRANSTTLVTFSTQTGNTLLFNVRLANGDVPPIAAEAFNELGASVGYVAQGGRLYVRELPSQGRLNIVWGSGIRDKCSFHYQESNVRDGDTLVTENVTCL